MKTTPIEWHPYPEERPPEEGWYPVTMKVEPELAVADRTSIFGLEFFEDGEWYDTYGLGDCVIAWAYPIEPYRREK